MLGERTDLRTDLRNPYILQDRIEAPDLGNDMMFAVRKPSSVGEISSKPMDAAVIDESGPIEKGVVERGDISQKGFDEARGNVYSAEASPSFDGGAAGGAAALSAAKGGSTDDVVTSGLMASGNPYAMAAGLGLAAFNADTKAKNEQNAREAAANNEQRANMASSARANIDAYHRMRNIL